MFETNARDDELSYGYQKWLNDRLPVDIWDALSDDDN